MDPHDVLLVGELPRSTSGYDGTELTAWVPGARRVADLSRALNVLGDAVAYAPSLIVLCERRPGVWSEAAVATLRAAAPLARLLRLSGSWCEGQSRSGRPPSGCPAIYWHRWPSRMAIELEASLDGRRPSWSQPLTATPEEQLLAGDSLSLGNVDQSGAILVRAPTSAASRALCEVCRRAGYQTFVAGAAAPAPSIRFHAILWDTHAAALQDDERIGRIREQSPGTPILAITSFPRPDDVRAACAAGVASVISKPFQTAELLWQLHQAGKSPPDSPLAT